MTDIDINNLKETVNQLKHILNKFEYGLNRISTTDDNVNKCYYAGNHQISTCEQFATTNIQMLGKKAPKYRSVCRKCKDYLTNNNLAVPRMLNSSI